MATYDRKRQLTSRTRLETFSDGVIAISITLTVLSIGHHYTLDRIEWVDRRIILLNLGFLACISLVPLVTAIVNEYPVTPSVMTYATVMTLAAVSQLGIWLHAERHGLVVEGVSDEERRDRPSRLLTLTGVFAASIPVALASTEAAQLMWLLILLRLPLVRLGGLRRRRETAGK